MSPPPKPKAPTALMAALFLLLAPTALAEQQPQPAAPIAQTQPAAAALADQPQIQVAQANPLEPAGDDNRRATFGDLRWSHAILRDQISENRDEITALRDENRAELRAIREEISALNNRITILSATLLAGVLGIFGVALAAIFPRKNAAPTESTRTLPRPTSA